MALDETETAGKFLMEHARNELALLSKEVRKHPKEISRKKMQGKQNSQVLLQVAEDALSRMRCSEVLGALLAALDSATDGPKQASGSAYREAGQYLEACRSHIRKYLQRNKTDPISKDFLDDFIVQFGYAVTD